MATRLLQIAGRGDARTHFTLDGVNPICNATHRHAMQEISGSTVTCQGCRDAWPSIRRGLDRLFTKETS